MDSFLARLAALETKPMPAQAQLGRYKTLSVGRARAEVLRFLVDQWSATGRPVRQRACSDHFGRSSSTIYVHIHSLKFMGLVEVSREGVKPTELGLKTVTGQDMLPMCPACHRPIQEAHGAQEAQEARSAQEEPCES